MRITQFYNLSMSQAAVDFVDVDVANDVKLFIDPQAFTILPSPWAHECVALIQQFFEKVISRIRDDDLPQAKRMLSGLREPNDTHLGLSKSRSRGSALGDGFADKILESLRGSRAVETGLLHDLEDASLLVEGIGADRVSDITTNLIREQLLSYTVEACEYYGIPLERNVSSGPIWRPDSFEWREEYTSRPVADGNPLLFVPKSIVREMPAYDSDEYYRNYILKYLEELELSASSALMRVARSGRRSVTKKALRQKYGVGKPTNLTWSEREPAILAAYKDHKRKHPRQPLDNSEIAEAVDAAPPDYWQLLQAVLDTPPGNADATNYHKRVEALLSALFHPHLVNPHREHPIHDGRKRIDITYTNAAQVGVFHWIGSHYPAPFIYAECKNYSRPIENKEFDQLSGRFSPSRGQVGLLLYRGFDDKERTLLGCRDTARDHRGYMVALDDGDLRILVEERTRQPIPETMGIIHARFKQLVS